MSRLDAARTRLRLLFSRRAAESRMDEEFRFHLEMEAERLVRERGIAPDEARRTALATFGGVQRHREGMREGRGLAWLGGATLDLKLGFRMLVKYPGLALVGGLAMAFAIWVGAITFEGVMMFVRPTLPLPGGDRVVHVVNRDVLANVPERRAMHEFVRWRSEVRSLVDFGAFRDVMRNLIGADGEARPLEVAELTATAFRIAPTPPLLGRALVAADERAGAPPVIVLGYETWRTRFAGDSLVVGRSVQLGDEFPTVVGVMPAGFAFPVAHDAWMPLRAESIAHAPREGPAITMFGRLAPGVTREEAQAEVATLGRRMATDFPATHEHLRPTVAPYATLFWEPNGGDWRALIAIELFAVLLVVLVCSNVALLLFARAATREGEIVVRTALGASRGRIVVQLVAEALVLGGVAAVIGLVAAQFALRAWGLSYLEVNMGRLPFWYDARISPLTVLWVALLTVLGAAISGVMPALKVTRGIGTRLRAGTAGGGGMKFGGVWTAVIVAQVAMTVAFPFLAFVEQRELTRIRSYDAGFPAEEYLAARLEMDLPPGAKAQDEAALAARRARFGVALEELRQRLAAEPGVTGVTFVDRLPRDYHRERLVEVDAGAAGAAAVRADSVRATEEVSLAWIDPWYFAVLEAPLVAGRAFKAADLSPDARVVIVDRGFVDRVLQGRNAIGRRLRFGGAGAPAGSGAGAQSPWYEIVGVVPELGMGYPVQRGRTAGVYLPGAPPNGGDMHVLVHAAGDPLSLGVRLRGLATSVDPTLRLSNLQRADQVTEGLVWLLGLWLRVTVVLTAIALLLSLAGIYAVLSYTVARRTREIGVRVALGASRHRVIGAIFRRPLWQVGVGVVVGSLLVGGMTLVVAEVHPTALQVAAFVAYSAVMFGVCLLACVVPTRRALRVEPTEALRAE